MEKAAILSTVNNGVERGYGCKCCQDALKFCPYFAVFRAHVCSITRACYQFIPGWRFPLALGLSWLAWALLDSFFWSFSLAVRLPSIILTEAMIPVMVEVVLLAV